MTAPSDLIAEAPEASHTPGLIAAAPDLHSTALELERLSLVIESAVRHSDPPHREVVLSLIRENRAAIAKAEGRVLTSPGGGR